MADRDLLNDVIETLTKTLSGEIEKAVKELLETKHLYQHHKVAIEPLTRIHEEYKRKAGGEFEQVLAKTVFGLCQTFWMPAAKAFASGALISQGARLTLEGRMVFSVPGIRIFCPKCDRIEPHNPHDRWSLIDEKDFHSDEPREQVTANPVHQVFILGFECQSCKSDPVVFLIRRIADKLIIAGRTPIEEVEVPKCIPRDTKKFYSDAIVAHQSGKTLAGLFYLRTFVEQTARSAVANPDQYDIGDKLMEAYAASLHLNVRSEFPSMRAVYDELSAALHAAEENVELFEKAITKINQHFEARRLYERLASKTTQ